jgi:predicted branched-subunit amino acid permease
LHSRCRYVYLHSRCCFYGMHVIPHYKSHVYAVYICSVYMQCVYAVLSGRCQQSQAEPAYCECLAPWRTVN